MIISENPETQNKEERMFRIRKSFTFEAAHQLETAVTAACHECVHGHSYTVELMVQAYDLGEHYMVVDFAELKPIKEWVMANWDHGVLFHQNKKKVIEPLVKKGVFKKEKVHFLPVNPTAEAMASILFKRLEALCVQLNQKALAAVTAESVRVHETSTGWAEQSDR